LESAEALEVVPRDRAPAAGGAQRWIEYAVVLADIVGLTAERIHAADLTNARLVPGRVARQRTAGRGALDVHQHRSHDAPAIDTATVPAQAVVGGREHRRARATGVVGPRVGAEVGEVDADR